MRELVILNKENADMKPFGIIEVPSSAKKTKAIDWIDNKFVSVKELFPNWLTAEIMLTEFVKETEDWIVHGNESNVDYGLEFPRARDQLTGVLVPMLDTFPPEDRPKVKQICEKLMEDYSDLEHLIGEKQTEQTRHMMLRDLKSRECEILSCGGRLIRQELSFRLGLWIF